MDQQLLWPGAYRAAGATGDRALVRAMVRVELAWLHALADGGAAQPEQVRAVMAALGGFEPTLDPRAVEAAGNPVLPLVRALREAVDDPAAAALVHRGLTSQDVLDTALMLLAQDVTGRIAADLARAAEALGVLATEHRRSVMPGRTLTQYAVPVTFGLKAAQWLVGMLDALEALEACRAGLPVQCGGAAGTLSLAADLVPDPAHAAELLAEQLGLRWPGMPWHSRRTPVTRLGDALVQCCDALGTIAADVLLLGRPEIGEVREAAAAGRGGSSTMPGKRNPVLAVLVRSASLQAPSSGAVLHACASLSSDERSDGAWHAEWPALRRLLELTATAASQAAELVAGLEVDAEVMARRARGAGHQLLAERGANGGTDPGSYLGVADQLVDVALGRLAARGGDGA